MLKHILFDFDGTLVDSREVFILLFNRIAGKYGFNKIEPHNLEELRNLPMMERFKYLKVPFYKVPFLTKEFLSLYESQIGCISLIPGMKDP